MAEASEMFKIDQLSTDITENVAKHLTPLDLIELTFVSNEWRNLVISFRIHVKTLYIGLKGLTQDPSTGVASIILGIQLVRRGFSHFFFYQRTQEQIDTELANDEKVLVRRYNGAEFKCKIDSSSVKVYTTDPLDAFYTVLDHCLRLFPGAPHHLSLGHVEQKLDDVVLQVLTLHQVGACETMAIPAGCIISERLLRHLFGMETLKSLYQNSACARGFKHNKPINIRHFTLPYAEWMNRKSLLLLNCETVELGDPKVTLKDLNAVILNWMNGENKRLRRISMNFCKGWSWENDKKGGRDLFVDLDTVTWIEGKSRRERFYEDRSKKLDCEKGKDITRADGALATILCDSSNFHFLVWSYPN